MLTTKDLLMVARGEGSGMVTKWYELGVELLDSDTGRLDAIERDGHDDYDRCDKMLGAWLRYSPNVSWSHLVTALNNIGLNTVADNIRHSKMLKKGLYMYTYVHILLFYFCIADILVPIL